MGFSRRTFLGGALATSAAPFVGWPSMATAATPQTLTTHVVNRSGRRAYCYIVGKDPGNNRQFFLTSDGRSRYYPVSPSQNNAPLAANVAIPIDATIELPRMYSGRVFFSIDRTLQFGLNPNPADYNNPGIVYPSAANPNDPNHDIAWGFGEFTFNQYELFVNISFVDFVGVPIAVDLDNQHVGGLTRGGLQQVAEELRTQSQRDGAPWGDLARSSGGNLVRVLSPKLTGAAGFGGYMDNYVNQVWNKYRNQDLIIDTQDGRWGIDRGRVRGGRLDFGVASFTKPSTQAIFNNSGAPFYTSNDEKGNITARLAAGLNRTILLDSDRQPASVPYYRQAHTNHYARVVHDVTANGLGYAFPYDDVTPSGGRSVEGSVRSGNPNNFTLTLNKP